MPIGKTRRLSRHPEPVPSSASRPGLSCRRNLGGSITSAPPIPRIARQPLNSVRLSFTKWYGSSLTAGVRQITDCFFIDAASGGAALPSFIGQADGRSTASAPLRETPQRLLNRPQPCRIGSTSRASVLSVGPHRPIRERRVDGYVSVLGRSCRLQDRFFNAAAVWRGPLSSTIRNRPRMRDQDRFSAIE